MQRILSAISENAIAVRTKAVKCLASLVEVDPEVLMIKTVEVNHPFFRNLIPNAVKSL